LRLDESSPPSTIGGGVMGSENGSRAAAVGFKGYFDEDRIRVTAGFAVARVRYDLTVSDTSAVPLQQEVVVFGLEVLTRVAERVFVGPQVMISGLDTELRRDSDSGSIPDEQLKADSVSLGLRAQRDTRDSTFYPRTGSFTDAQLRFYDPALGSSFTYQVLPLAFNHYYSLDSKSVFASRASLRASFGDVPFYGEGFYGAGPDLRGYTVGTLHDDVLIAAQGEYRRELVGWLGAVAFAGVGALAPEIDELWGAELLPSAGFGLRFTLQEANHVNMRIDLAWGRDQSAIYFGVGEAF
jgi:outer membrane protein assembly factor BamA